MEKTGAIKKVTSFYFCSVFINTDFKVSYTLKCYNSTGLFCVLVLHKCDKVKE